MNQINDPGISPEDRLAALRVVAGQESFPDWVVESNNHIHTCYSFSPHTPRPRPGRRRRTRRHRPQTLKPETGRTP